MQKLAVTKNYETIDSFKLEDGTTVRLRHLLETDIWYVVRFRNYKIETERCSDLLDIYAFRLETEALDKFCRICGFEDDLEPEFEYESCFRVQHFQNSMPIPTEDMIFED